ncbi:YgaP family membrane protein [Xylophilus sp.]|uniref:YgaP family membrane protein n=1 Tax=Xylophilus sp. TaxID=2653893 RepID=UPI0013B5D922|nr:DUF2892 domain-containing protein [Xylophilus sp.]KAF1049131.1 MAG: hypothetical protein GAK38_00899 [Xylophilus sp.]
MAFPATTASRVTANTSDFINRRIREETDASVRGLAGAGTAVINVRLRELDQEWDIERCLETGASSLIVLGTALGLTAHRRWLLLPAGVAAFLLQHALQGWCPPLPVFRRLGVRTAEEINVERYALKALRGDFGAVDPAAPSAARRALLAARKQADDNEGSPSPSTSAPAGDAAG